MADGSRYLSAGNYGRDVAVAQSPLAVAWCLNGAILAEEPMIFKVGIGRLSRYRGRIEQMHEILRAIREATGEQHWTPIVKNRPRELQVDEVDWNNAPETTHADVLAVLDEAIRRYEGREDSMTQEAEG